MAGLSLITAATIHWNTVYLDRAVRQLRVQGAAVLDDLLAHVTPGGWEHIGLTGDYGSIVTDPSAVPAATRNSYYVPAAALGLSVQF